MNFEPNFRERLIDTQRKEFNHTDKVHHKNVIRTYESIENATIEGQDVICLINEFVRGIDLCDLMIQR